MPAPLPPAPHPIHFAFLHLKLAPNLSPSSAHLICLTLEQLPPALLQCPTRHHTGFSLQALVTTLGVNRAQLSKLV